MNTVRHRLPAYAWIGLGVILISEVLMFQDVEPVATFFTAIVWTGYILLMDGLVYRIKGASLIRTRPKEFLFLVLFSIVLWLIFEFYNFHLRNWTYENLPENLLSRWLGYAWVFATILPGVFETVEWIEANGWFARMRVRPLKLPPMLIRQSVLFGALFSFGPLFAPEEVAPYLFAFVWVGYALMLDPLNYFPKDASLFGDLEQGRLDRFASYFAAGLICGLLWEFWNYWAHARWVYTVPIMQNFKLFEMPLVWYLGFPAFAYECFVMTTFAKRWWGVKERGISEVERDHHHERSRQSI
ncbi:MAG: hypothetical protein FJY97_09875 [candidate division Zixibacteria bacterium]|nr:hypothetical protein [candidate division Zixibacteria bacterium]